MHLSCDHTSILRIAPLGYVSSLINPVYERYQENVRLITILFMKFLRF